MFLKSVNEFGAAHATGGEFEHQALLFVVHKSVDLAVSRCTRRVD